MCRISGWPSPTTTTTTGNAKQGGQRGGPVSTVGGGLPRQRHRLAGLAQRLRVQHFRSGQRRGSRECLTPLLSPPFPLRANDSTTATGLLLFPIRLSINIFVRLFRFSLAALALRLTAEDGGSTGKFRALRFHSLIRHDSNDGSFCALWPFGI